MYFMYFESFKLQKCFSDTRWRHVLADEKKWKLLTFPPQSVQRNWSRCLHNSKLTSVKETAAQKRKRFRKRREKEFSVYNTKVETHSS